MAVNPDLKNILSYLSGLPIQQWEYAKPISEKTGNVKEVKGYMTRVEDYAGKSFEAFIARLAIEEKSGETSANIKAYFFTLNWEKNPDEDIFEREKYASSMTKKGPIRNLFDIIHERKSSTPN